MKPAFLSVPTPTLDSSLLNEISGFWGLIRDPNLFLCNSFEPRYFCELVCFFYGHALISVQDPHVLPPPRMFSSFYSTGRDVTV